MKNVKATAKVQVLADDNPDASMLGEVTDAYSLGDLPWPGPGEQQERDRCGRRLWYHPANNWPYDPQDWAHVGADILARVKAEHGGPVRASFAYAKHDRDRLYRLDRGGWWYVGIVLTVFLTGRDARTGNLWTREESDSLWGIESDSGREYLRETLTDCAAEVYRRLSEPTISRGIYDQAIQDAWTEVDW